MTIVADRRARAQIEEVTGGVDTHADVHVAAAIDQVGRELGSSKLPDHAGRLRGPGRAGWRASAPSA